MATMEKKMKQLYKKLWGNPEPIIKEFPVEVPIANYRMDPEYKMNIRSSGNGIFAPPVFEPKTEEQVFRIVDVGVNLPCGMKKLLIRLEQDKVYQQLIKKEAIRWKGVRKRSKIPNVDSKLDYEISDQPGTGRFFLL